MKIEVGKLCYNLSLGKLEKATHSFEIEEGVLQDKIAVHCQTKEDWGYVVSKGYELRGYVGDTFYPLDNCKCSRIESYEYRFISIKKFKEFYPESEQVLNKVKDKVLFQDKIDYAAKSTKVVESMNNQELGIKESEGKLPYELDWDFIEGMALRMDLSDKYPPYNWKKTMDKSKLEEACTRHFMEIIRGRYEDDGQKFGHIFALATDLMMLYYQLKDK